MPSKKPLIIAKCLTRDNQGSSRELSDIIKDYHIQMRKLSFTIDVTAFVLKMCSYCIFICESFCFLKPSRNVLSGVSGIVFAYVTDKIVPGVFLS